MMLRGHEPPKRGSPKEQVLKRMFAMEQAQQFEMLGTIAWIIAAACGVNKAAAGYIGSMISKYHGTLNYARWSNDRKVEEERVVATDDQILAKVAALSAPRKKGK
jgi:hypothetical protein